jgi:hypothetical protein
MTEPADVGDAADPGRGRPPSAPAAVDASDFASTSTSSSKAGTKSAAKSTTKKKAVRVASGAGSSSTLRVWFSRGEGGHMRTHMHTHTHLRHCSDASPWREGVSHTQPTCCILTDAYMSRGKCKFGNSLPNLGKSLSPCAHHARLHWNVRELLSPVTITPSTEHRDTSLIDTQTSPHTLLRPPTFSQSPFP